MLKNNKMYRNTYLQLYKKTASHQHNPTILLTHFTQIYNTLGCVLQDLQYQIGRMALPNSKSNEKEEKPKEDYQAYQPKQKQNTCPPQSERREANPIPKQPQPYTNPKKPSFLQQIIKAQQPLSHPKYPPTPQISPNTKYNTVHRNAAQPSRNSDSFDELFDYGQQSSIKKPSNLPVVQQQQNEPIQNTYDDFLDRIFKQTESRRHSK